MSVMPSYKKLRVIFLLLVVSGVAACASGGTSREQPAAQIVDLFDALKKSLSEVETEKATGTDGAAPPARAPKRKRTKVKGPRKAG